MNSNDAPEASLGGNPEIVHFDATIRRRDKMRQKAANGRGDSSGTSSTDVPPIVVEPVPTPSPVPELPPTRTASTPTSGTAAALSGQELESFLVNFVVEQTGYPTEMVEMDADLEADLGIDSIKKAQLFGELAEYFDVQVAGESGLSLDEFSTLRHVMDFLSDPSLSGAPTPPEPSQPTEAGSSVAVSETTSSLLSGEELQSFLINFVVEQTGYPTEMVELDADLEADLGIDSIKKAQLFGELAEYFDIRVDDGGDLSLDEFPTLRHVMNFLSQTGSQSSTASEPANSSVPEQSTPSPSALGGPELEHFLINFVVEQTGYPTEMVELDADLEADLGIDSIKKAQLFGELAEYFDVQGTGSEELSLDAFPTLRHVMDFLIDSPQRGPVSL